MKTIEVNNNSAIVKLSSDELKWLMFLTDASISVSNGDSKHEFSFGKIDSLIESAIYNQNKVVELEKLGLKSNLSINDSAELNNDIKYLVDTIKHLEV